ncbi:MAG: radical SAM protein [Planctomycetota bacterium]
MTDECRIPDPPGNALPPVLDAFQEAASRACIPLNAVIELTHRCNLLCTHCYNRDRNRAAGDCPELSVEEVFPLLAALRDEGNLFIALTGGEPLLHPRFFDILDRARDLHQSVQILTNGTLLDAAIVAKLASYPNLLGVSVSVYGARKGTHDAITRTPGAFVRTWEGTRRLRDAGIRVRVKFLLMTSNAGEAAEMIARARAEGMPFTADAAVTARHDGDPAPLNLRLGEDALLTLYRGPLRRLAPGPAAVTSENFACNCARGNCAISATGDIYPCISVPLPAGNIREASFANLWKNSPVLKRIRRLGMEDFPSCRDCRILPWCIRDRGAAYLASGKYTGVDPWICRQAEILRRAAEAPAAP